MGDALERGPVPSQPPHLRRRSPPLLLYYCYNRTPFKLMLLGLPGPNRSACLFPDKRFAGLPGALLQSSIVYSSAHQGPPSPHPLFARERSSITCCPLAEGCTKQPPPHPLQPLSLPCLCRGLVNRSIVRSFLYDTVCRGLRPRLSLPLQDKTTIS